MDKATEDVLAVVLAVVVWVLLLSTATGRALLDAVLKFYGVFI